MRTVLSWIHGAGRRVFLAVERGFNALFGEAANPLYHLGSISCLLFALVAVSGFYVYAFYETGVDTTFASVERLTHVQWWAGGVMRSVHRYASDAMVLTMLLHLARHFFFDRYRGFRAFSWITGVVLLWLVYVSGVNGYMLPWDRLAQFTVVATAEWFDALPVFRGTLVRNFILPEAITDRFFSLLQFLHIGVPLAALAALWIHVQRVPRARVFPPRPLAIGLVAMLLALSLARPAVSQGAAALDSVPAALAVDWFYLPALVLAQAWSALGTWALVGAGTVLALLLPWLPPRRGSGTAWQLTVHPGSRAVPVRPGETLLEAGLRAELPMPFDCRAGGCGRCVATVLHGEVDPRHELAVALTPQQRARGEVLTCCACALGDVEIELEAGAAAADAAARVVRARVAALRRLAPEVMGVSLELEGGRRMAWSAGQYLNVVLDDGQRRAYSFTEPGGESGRIELHIRRMPGGRFTTRVFVSMREGDVLDVEGPLGGTGLERLLDPQDARPFVLVAGATGFAPVKSLLEEAFRARVARPLHFYWGVRRPQDFYLRELPEAWSREHPNFRFVPVISEPAPGDGWHGRTGLVHEAILQDFPDLAGCTVYACGSVKMVEAARPAFVAHGLAEEACLSDAFVPATRQSAA